MSHTDTSIGLVREKNRSLPSACLGSDGTAPGQWTLVNKGVAIKVRARQTLPRGVLPACHLLGWSRNCTTTRILLPLSRTAQPSSLRLVTTPSADGPTHSTFCTVSGLRFRNVAGDAHVLFQADRLGGRFLQLLALKELLGLLQLERRFRQVVQGVAGQQHLATIIRDGRPLSRVVNRQIVLVDRHVPVQRFDAVPLNVHVVAHTENADVLRQSGVKHSGMMVFGMSSCCGIPSMYF